jgi:hypothetical protein
MATNFPRAGRVFSPTVSQRPQLDGMALGKEFADTIRRNRAVSAEMKAARLFPDDPVQQAKEYLRITGEGGRFFAPTDAPSRYLGAVEAKRKEQLEERKTKATERTADAAIINALKPPASSGETAAIRTLRTKLEYAAEIKGLQPGSPDWVSFVNAGIAKFFKAGHDLTTEPVPGGSPTPRVDAGAPEDETPAVAYPVLLANRPLNDVYNDVQTYYAQLTGLREDLNALPDGAIMARRAVQTQIDNLGKQIDTAERTYAIRTTQVGDLRKLATSPHYLGLSNDLARTAAVLPLITDVLDSVKTGKPHNVAIIPQLSRYLVTLVGDDKIGSTELKMIDAGGKDIIRSIGDWVNKGFLGTVSIDTLTDIRNLILKVHTFKQDRVIEQWLKDKKQYGSDVEFSRAFERPVSDRLLLEYYKRNGTPEEKSIAIGVLKKIEQKELESRNE